MFSNVFGKQENRDTNDFLLSLVKRARTFPWELTGVNN